MGFEFDVGIWYEDYKTHAVVLEKQFEDLSFIVNKKSKDRIKLVHKNLTIGAYTIDIHTYHIKGDTAYVSFNRSLHNPGFSTYLYRLLSFFDERKLIIYPLAPMIKCIMKNQPNIPCRFYFKKGKYTSANSFLIETDVKIYNNDKLYSKKLSPIRKITFCAMHPLNHILPKELKYTVLDALSRRLDVTKKEHAIVQAIPIHYLKHLSKINFHNLSVSCPTNYKEYLVSIYGDDWNIPKSNWINTQNKINTELNKL